MKCGMQERGAQALDGLSTSSQDVGSTETLQQAEQRGSENDRAAKELCTTQCKTKGCGAQKSFPEARALFHPTCCRIAPGTKLCLVPNASCSREV